MAQRLYLILYDISSPKRWRKVYRRLLRQGAWAQLSAFYCRLAPAERDALESELRALLNPLEDRLIIAELGLQADGVRCLGTMAASPQARLRIV